VDSQKRALSITMLEAEPRPEGGEDGDVTVEAGENVFHFSWKGGKLVGVTGGPKRSAVGEDAVPKMTEGELTCQMCARDKDGEIICWTIPC
jgi:hypothetical protein